jgi:ribonuclease VapC
VIVDTSVVLAVLLDEPEARRYAEAIADAPRRSLSAATYVEAGIVVDGNRDPVLARRFDDLLDRAEIAIAPVTAEHATVARQAYRDYGKGSGHPARLNFGDCFSYALARVSGEPLLFKGEDFTHTDVEPALR